MKKKIQLTERNNNMKFALKAVSAAVAAGMMLVTGCKSVPTPEKMRSASYAIGVAAGLVANETKIDDKTRNTVVSVVQEVAKATPAKGQSFEDAWTPVAKELVAKFVAEGKIDEAQGQLVLSVFGIAVKGIDYIFDVRYPKAREYEELVAAAVSGFTDGFLSVFTPAEDKGSKAIEAAKADNTAYKWLKEKCKTK